MPRFTRLDLLALLLLLTTAACYRLPLRIKENDASGYEDIGVPVIEAVEYTPNGRDLRVALEGSGYVTILVVDPMKGATVRFRRGDRSSTFAEKGVHRFPLDRLASPMTLAVLNGSGSATRTSRGLGRPSLCGATQRGSILDPSAFGSSRADSALVQGSLSLVSRRVTEPGTPVSSAHVVVLVTEQPLDLIGVATRLAQSSLDPALAAQAAANVVEGGRWIAATAQLRGQ
jgi:hypothetical protein